MRILLGILAALSFSLAAAQTVNINLTNATINGESLCELSIDEATDLLGRPSAVQPPIVEALGDEIFYHDQGLNLQFNSSTVDPEERLLILQIYLAETYDEERVENYLPFSGTLEPAVDANFKVEKTQSTLDDLSLSYVVVTPDDHRKQLEDLGIPADPLEPQSWTVRYQRDVAYTNFQHEELTQFLETASIACRTE